MIVYGNILSFYVTRIVIAARFKGVAVELTMPSDGFKTPAFLALNPLGKAPTIVDGEVTLFESGVILEYLEQAYPQPPLLPADAAAAARVRLAGQIFATYINEPIFALFMQRDPAKRDAAACASNLAAVQKGLEIAEARYATGLADGAPLSQADCYAAPCLWFVETTLPAFGIADPLTPFPALSAYADRLRADPIIGAVLLESDDAFDRYVPGAVTAAYARQRQQPQE